MKTVPVRRPRPRTAVRWIGASFTGVALGGATYTVLDAGRCPVVLTVAVVVLLTCTVPSGRSLSRRIAVNGLTTLGFLPVTWMLAVFSSINHGALAVALVTGLLSLHVLVAPSPARALRGLVPSVAPADLLLLPSLLFSLIWGWRLFTIRTPARALEVLLPGYDHGSHFDMFQLMWRHGTTIDTLGTAPDGTSWEFANYPAGFHAVAASMAQLWDGRHPAGAGAAMVTFAHADAAMVVCGTVVASACLISLSPRPRVLPLVLPLTLLLTACLWLPGGQVLWHAFENFWLAAVMTAAGILLAARALLRGTESLGGLVAGMAAAVGTGLNWLPLMSVCWIVPVVVFATWWRSRPIAWQPQLAGLAISMLAALTGLRTVIGLLRSTHVSTLIGASGGIQASAIGPLVLTFVLFAGLTLALGGGTGRLSDPRFKRLRWCGLGVLSGTAVAVMFAVIQKVSEGSVDYYAIKMSLGVLLVAACWVAGMLALALDLLLPETGPAFAVGWVRAAAVVLASLACTQLLGHMSLADADQQARRTVDRDLAGRKLDYYVMARDILAAASSVDSRRGFHSEYLALGPAHCYNASLPNAWFHALTTTLSVHTGAQSEGLDIGAYSVADAIRPVRAALRQDPSLTLLVSPNYITAIRNQLGPDLGKRLDTWPARTVS